MKKTSKKTEVTKNTKKSASKKAASKSVKTKSSVKTTKKPSKAVSKTKNTVVKTKQSKQVKEKVVKPKKLIVDKFQDEQDSKDPEKLLGDRRHPRGWKIMTYEQKLDYIASRIIAEDRHGITSHKELKESGILSTSQYERRRNREVYSQTGDLDSVKVKPGVFSRSHVRDIRGVRNVPKPTTEETTYE